MFEHIVPMCIDKMEQNQVNLDFVANYDSNEEYKQFVQSGTGSKENVRGRFDYWRKIVKEL